MALKNQSWYGQPDPNESMFEGQFRRSTNPYLNSSEASLEQLFPEYTPQLVELGLNNVPVNLQAKINNSYEGDNPIAYGNASQADVQENMFPISLFSRYKNGKSMPKINIDPTALADEEGYSYSMLEDLLSHEMTHLTQDHSKDKRNTSYEMSPYELEASFVENKPNMDEALQYLLRKGSHSPEDY